MKWIGAFTGRPRLAMAVAIGLVAVLGVVDYFTGVEISFSIFYFIPVALASWFAGRRDGLLIAALCCASWALSDSILGGHRYSNLIIPLWNALMRGMIFAILALLASGIRDAMHRGDRAFLALENAFDELDRTRREQLLLKDRLLSHVSHELRTPLTALHQFLTILHDGLAGELTGQQREYVGIALRNAEQLRRMIADLLESTRAESGKLVVDVRATDVGEIVRDIVRTSRSPAAEAGIELVDAIPADVPTVRADPARVRQVLLNLVDNALKFTPGPGTVTLTAGPQPDRPGHLAISVMDTGRGISPEALPRLFTRLYQEDRTTEAGRKGLGLGLHICRELVTRQGGRIWAESELGRGTKVTFTLPVAAEAQGAGDRDDQDHPDSRG